MPGIVASATGGHRRADLLGSVAWLLVPYCATPVRRLASVLRREAGAVLLCQEYEEGRFDQCVALGRLLHVPVFATYQGGNHTRTPLERLLRGWAVRASAGLVVAAGGEADRVEASYRLPPSRVARIANPVDLGGPDPPGRRVARRQLGLPLDAATAMWHGRVELHRKGLDTLVDAWAQVSRDRPARDLALVLVGTGPDAAALRDRISAAGRSGIYWRDEYVLDRRVLASYLAAADVYVFPSRHEGFAVAPMEAMAAGLPVVSGTAPGAAELLADGGGIVVPGDDPVAWASGLGGLLDDLPRARAMGRRGRRSVQDHFSSAAVGAQLRSFLLGSVRRGRPTGADRGHLG